VLEYYPFGGTRLDQRPDNTFNEQRRSDGHEFDTGTGLLYEDARYLGPTLSRFLSEDPNFIAAGAPDWVTGAQAGPTYAALTGFVNNSSVNYLESPQNLNSYSYVNNNPLKYTDPTGKFIPFAVALGYVLTTYGIAQTFVDAYDVYNTDFKYSNVFTDQEKLDSATNLTIDLVTPGLSGTAEKFVKYAGLGKALDYVSTGSGILDAIKGVVDRSPNLKKRDQSIQIAAPTPLSSPNFSIGGGSPNNGVMGQPRQQSRQTWVGGSSLTPAQTAALNSISSTFTPTNPQQAAAIQNVISAFARK